MKKMWISGIVFMVLLPCCCSEPVLAQDKWTKNDTIKEAAFLSLLYLEKCQRSYAQKHGGMYMPNPLLGPSRSQSDVDKFMIGMAIIHPAVSYFLPRPYRDWWQYGTLIVSGTSIGGNMSLGVGFDF